jgi:hypothetical protein
MGTRGCITLMLALLGGSLGVRGAQACDEILGAGILFHQDGARLGCDIFAGEKRATGCFEGFLPFEELPGAGPVKEIVVRGCRAANTRHKASTQAASSKATPAPAAVKDPKAPSDGKGNPQDAAGAKDTKSSAEKGPQGQCGDPLKIAMRGFELVEVKVTGGTKPGTTPVLTLMRQRDIRP